jgi:hypothetical protein
VEFEFDCVLVRKLLGLSYEDTGIKSGQRAAQQIPPLQGVQAARLQTANP